MSHKIVSNLFIYANQGKAENLVISRRNKQLVFAYYFPNNKREKLSLPQKYAASFFKHLYSALGLNKDELVTQKPGEFSYKNHYFKFQASAIPDQEGEKIIIHFKNKPEQLEKNWRLNELGLGQKEAVKIRAALCAKAGLILIAGAENSGKSSTLNALISEIDHKRRNVCFIYKQKTGEIAGVNYFKWSEANIKTILKHDADIVVFDEISSTAILSEALSLASMGKLVIATIKAAGPKELAEKIKAVPMSEAEKISALKMIIFQKIEKLKRSVKNKKDKRQEIGRFQIIDFRKK